MSQARPANWKSVAPATATTKQSLPKLPVLELSDTLEKLKGSLKPIAWSQEEYATVAKKIDEFGKPGGLGERLQTRLKAHDAQSEHWLEQWWDDGGYLGYRDSVRVFLYPSFVVLTERTGRRECLILL